MEGCVRAMTGTEGQARKERTVQTTEWGYARIIGNHVYPNGAPTTYCPYHDRIVSFCYNEEHWAYECDQPTSVPDTYSLHHVNALKIRGGRYSS